MADTKEKKPNKPSIKYQAKIHKAYSELIDKEAKAEAIEALEGLKKLTLMFSLPFSQALWLKC